MGFQARQIAFDPPSRAASQTFVRALKHQTTRVSVLPRFRVAIFRQPPVLSVHPALQVLKFSSQITILYLAIPYLCNALGRHKRILGVSLPV